MTDDLPVDPADLEAVAELLQALAEAQLVPSVVPQYELAQLPAGTVARAQHVVARFQAAGAL
ncbi:MAG: hypothetical protein ACYTAF_07710 [Planctomycetota bacterium]|jgi:hypothetical protein